MATSTVKIYADEIQQSELSEKDQDRDERHRSGGIYHTRSRSVGRHNSIRPNARLSFDARGRHAGAAVDGEDGEEWQCDDGRKKQVFKGTALFWLAYQSTGVIYGDIGTSPLYVFSSTFTDTPTRNDILQVLSLVIWSLTIMVTLKYVAIVLHADNEGEGGTFSCYSLLSRYAHITDRDPREAVTIKMERHKTQDLSSSNRTLRSTIERSKFTRGLLKVIGVLAVSMVMSDGILTPAQSVLGAIQGLNVVNPNISGSTVVGTTCGILVLLFLVQPFGTAKLATAFAPIVVLWLGFNAGFGIYNLVKFDHSVLKAFSPYYAIHFFMEKKTEGWRMLGGVLLAFTGVEALFADLGAFSMRAIQISWLGYCYPCLLLAYIGQAAYLSVTPSAYTNPLYNSVPPGMLYPTLVLAILAAIVASQAIITATFQLISQMLKLSYCPQLKIVHTSTKFHGQIYVPFFNWLLLAGTILVTCVYSNTTSLGNAYGVCVMFVTFFDTCMVTLVALIVWRLPPWAVVIPWLFFSTFDGLYLSSALTKVPEGAWFTITISGVLACLFLLWRFGKENQWRAEAEDRFKLQNLVTRDDDGNMFLTDRFGGGSISRIRGLGIYFDKTGVLTPTVFTQFVTKFGAMPEVAIFFHLHPVETPSVSSEERFAISALGNVPGSYRLVVRHGFMDEVITPDLALLIYEQMRNFIIRRSATRAKRREDAAGEANATGVNVAGNMRRSDHEWAKQTSAALTKVPPAEANDEDGLDDDSKSKANDDLQTDEEVLEPNIPIDYSISKIPSELRDEATREELAVIDRAYASKIMYVIGKEQMKIRPGTGLPRRIMLNLFLWLRENTRNKVANLRLSMERVVEVGFVKDV